jgi:tRNA-Thr(GGU) m(6)t(6)A37 methyltransferase TsaA
MTEPILKPIGTIKTPHKTLDECPRNIEPEGPICQLVLDEALWNGLMGLKVGQRILILYWCDSADRTLVQQYSRRTKELAGVFALRTPNRCNPIGAAVLPIARIEEGSIFVRGLDCLNGTPLLDIKPAMDHE